MDEALRTVFVLHEIEELTMAQIAETLLVHHQASAAAATSVRFKIAAP